MKKGELVVIKETLRQWLGSFENDVPNELRDKLMQAYLIARKETGESK